MAAGAARGFNIHGRPPVYGTQYRTGEAGELVLHPIEDAEGVDERRRQVGLPPMAEQEKAVREIYR
jgi:hypothetical protein